MNEQINQPHDAGPGEVAPTYRWRRREVLKVRVTWLGMVFVLFLMVHSSLLKAMPALTMTGKVGTFVAIVVLPTLALVLWRLGLLPPERVRVDGPPAA